jgi:serine/threonine-protein kinase SRPK3
MFTLLANEEDVNAHHLAQMVALLGAPPPDLLRQSTTKIPWQYFSEQGEWKGLVDLPQDTLERSEENLGGDDKALFLSFVRRMVQWKPQDRSAARELLEDPWLQDQQAMK